MDACSHVGSTSTSSWYRVASPFPQSHPSIGKCFRRRGWLRETNFISSTGHVCMVQQKRINLPYCMVTFIAIYDYARGACVNIDIISSIG